MDKGGDGTLMLKGNRVVAYHAVPFSDSWCVTLRMAAHPKIGTPIDGEWWLPLLVAKRGGGEATTAATEMMTRRDLETSMQQWAMPAIQHVVGEADTVPTSIETVQHLEPFSTMFRLPMAPPQFTLDPFLCSCSKSPG
jgi:hypothetical protein